MISFKEDGRVFNHGEPTYPSVEIKLETEATLESAVQAFEAFLRAVGYVFDGHLEIVRDENLVPEEN